MFEEMKKILREKYGIEEVEPNSNLRKDLGLTSFDFANLICIMEERFGIEIDTEKYREIVTAEDFVNYLRTLTDRK